MVTSRRSWRLVRTDLKGHKSEVVATGEVHLQGQKSEVMASGMSERHRLQEVDVDQHVRHDSTLEKKVW